MQFNLLILVSLSSQMLIHSTIGTPPPPTPIGTDKSKSETSIIPSHASIDITTSHQPPHGTLDSRKRKAKDSLIQSSKSVNHALVKPRKEESGGAADVSMGFLETSKSDSKRMYKSIDQLSQQAVDDTGSNTRKASLGTESKAESALDLSQSNVLLTSKLKINNKMYFLRPDLISSGTFGSVVFGHSESGENIVLKQLIEHKDYSIDAVEATKKGILSFFKTLFDGLQKKKKQQKNSGQPY